MQEHSETFADAGFGSGGEINVEEDGKREKFEFTRTAYPRDPRFKKWVLDAYDQACCICDRQLGIVEAAHIIPHSADGSPNDITNGLALCIEHHRLYDRALLLPGPKRKLVVNPDRAEYLKQTDQAKGIDQILNMHGKEYRVPERSEHHPNDDYLEHGLAARMGK